jgi:sulfonate transport system substrate-binding protein
MMDNLSRRGVLGAGLAAAMLSACGARTPDEVVIFGDQANLTRAKVEAAGLLKDRPYAFRWANFAGAAPLFEAVMAGAVDTAPAGDTPVLAAAAAGVPIKLLAASQSSGRGVALLVSPDSPIKTLHDLRGRNVIVSSARGSVAHYLLLGALKEAGLKLSDVTIGFMLPGDAQAAFDAKRIEVWATFGLYQALAEYRGARVLRDGVGINTGLGFITASERALASPVKRRAIADALQQFAAANAWANSHKDQYAAVFAKVTKAPLAVAQLLVERENPILTPVTPAAIAKLQTVADTFFQAGLLPKAVNAAALADTSLLPG